GAGGATGGSEGVGAGGIASGGAAGFAGAAGAAGSAGVAGAGGNALDCGSPYPDSIGGPRQDGVEQTSVSCSMISDELILERYASMQAKVPRGLYWAPGVLSVWDEPCSDSADRTLERGAQAELGTFEAAFTTPWY